MSFKIDEVGEHIVRNVCCHFCNTTMDVQVSRMYHTVKTQISGLRMKQVRELACCRECVAKGVLDDDDSEEISRIVPLVATHPSTRPEMLSIVRCTPHSAGKVTLEALSTRPASETPSTAKNLSSKPKVTSRYASIFPSKFSNIAPPSLTNPSNMLLKLKGL